MQKVVTAFAAWLTNVLHLPKRAAQVVQHVVIVFVTAFVAQVVGSHVGHFDWPAVTAVVTSAAAAGGSAVLHYLTSLVPTPQQKQPSAKARKR